MNYNIKILSKEECTLMSTRSLEEDCIIISINDTNCKTVIFENERILKVLKTTFDDIEVELPIFELFSMFHAEEIKNFVDSYRDKVNTIIVHCTAGISRSGAIGCCLARYLNGSDEYLLKTGKYVPNKHIYKIMCKVLGLEYSNEMFKEKIRLRNKGNRKNLKGYGDYGIDLDDMFCDVIIDK